jgi:hypothetical protein
MPPTGLRVQGTELTHERPRRGRPVHSSAPVRSGQRPVRLLAWAIVSTTFGQLGGREYSLVGEASLAEAGKVRYLGPFREWAIVAAILLAVLALLSWGNPLFVGAFVVAAVVSSGVAVYIHYERPPAELE